MIVDQCRLKAKHNYVMYSYLISRMCRYFRTAALVLWIDIGAVFNVHQKHFQVQAAFVVD